MPRKVFISVLGTGKYSECIYAKDNFQSVPTKYIQRATLDYLQCVEPWTNDDTAFILTTAQAFKCNWLPFDTSRSIDCIPLLGLKDELEAQHYSFECKQVDIPLGNNDKEMWKIFETVFALLKEGDELYFDLTHSFRYQPMLILVLGNYAKFVKKVKVRHISYGNFEGRNRETNVAQINDLLPLTQLQDWTFAIAEYVEDGHSKRIKDLTLGELKPLLIEAETRKTASPLRKFSDCIHDLCSQMETCRGKDVVEGTAVKKIREQLDNINEVLIAPMSPLLGKVKDDISGFSSQRSVSNMFAAARWCFDHQQYQQSITFLQEGVISFFCEKCGWNIENKVKRGLVTSALSIITQKTPENEWEVDAENFDDLRKLVNDIIGSDSAVPSICAALTEYRNDYNHCNMRDKKFTPQSIKDKIKESLDQIEKLLYNDQPDDKEVDNVNNIFLNISNHPVNQWSEEQRKAAEKYGELQELEFPKIEPIMSSGDIAELASQWYNDIMVQYANCNLTVHVMGEMTFTHSLVSLLKDNGIRCVASTTERNVVDEGEKKISVFKFVSFREY